MALFRSEGFDELIDDLSAHKMDFVRAAPAMLKAGIGRCCRLLEAGD